MRWAPSSFLGRRSTRVGLIGGSILLLVWIGASLEVAHRLTSRRRPPFPEPIPAAVRDPGSAHRLRTSDGQEIGAWYFEGKEDALSPSVAR